MSPVTDVLIPEVKHIIFDAGDGESSQNIITYTQFSSFGSYGIDMFSSPYTHTVRLCGVWLNLF